jgi:hypothetical protein
VILSKKPTCGIIAHITQKGENMGFGSLMFLVTNERQVVACKLGCYKTAIFADDAK